MMRRSVKVYLAISLLAKFVLSQSAPHHKLCGSLDLRGSNSNSSFKLFDLDQSANLEGDERFLLGAWNVGKMRLQVERGCSIQLCNETYFEGSCETVGQGLHEREDVASVKCNCEKQCKCSDIFMKKNSCARAYLQGGCRTCNTPYVELQETSGVAPKDLPLQFIEEYADQVEALRLRKGCKLTLFKPEEDSAEEEEDDDGGLVIDDEIVENFRGGAIGSYECICDDSKFVPRAKPSPPKSYPPLVQIPDSMDEVIRLLQTRTYKSHPGLAAAFQSLKGGRSSKNAYILLLGSTGSGKSSAINVLFDNPNLTKVGETSSTTTDIHEFRIPVPIDEIGVANSELRVIDTPGMGDTRGLEQDARFLATLDDFLSSHEELKNRIPNAVLIFHKFNDNRFNGVGSRFVRMLRGFDSFRKKITDENFSNVVFVFSHFCSSPKRDQRRPEKRLQAFKDVIENYSEFSRPTIVTVAENRPSDNDLLMVNGYARLPNKEYYPRNLFEKLELVTEKGGDLISQGVFRTAFRNSDDFNITRVDFKLLPNKNDKVSQYLSLLSSAMINVQDTEISKLLKHVWDERISSIVKRNNPQSLHYLQKVLNLKNIHKRSDIPKTTTEVLDLHSSLKHDQATMELIEKGLEIKPPQFPQNVVAGYGYNVFMDAPLPSSPFVMGNRRQSIIGYMLPQALTCSKDPGTKEHLYLFDDKEGYVKHRLHALGIDGTVANQSFTGGLKPGHNIKSASFKPNSCSLTGSREFRLFKLELNDKLDLTPEFQRKVRNLPPFNESDHENVEAWNSFFSTYGTHVVRSVYGGGVIEIQLESDKACNVQASEAMFGLIKFAEEMSFLFPEDTAMSSSSGWIRDKSIRHSLKFIGGSMAYHTTDLTKLPMEDASRLLGNWKKSLKYYPTLLTTEMRLLSMGQVVKKLGQRYSSEIERATSLLFHSSLKFKPPPQKVEMGPPPPSREETERLTKAYEVATESNRLLREQIAKLQELTVCRNVETWPHLCKTDCDCRKERYCSNHGFCHDRGVADVLELISSINEDSDESFGW